MIGYDASEEYMMGKDEAEKIIVEVKEAVSHWRNVAKNIGIAKRELDLFEQVFDERS